MKNDNIIDLGNITVPTSWDDITLGQYQEIERYYENEDRKFDIRDVIHIMCSMKEDDINAMPIEFLDRILERMSFIETPPERKEPRNWVEIGGERYTVHTENKLRTGEYVAADTLIKSDSHNYAGLLAILCRKDGEAYDSRFENEILEERQVLFEGIPVTDALRIIDFFLTLWVASESPTLLYSRVSEALDHTQSSIETSQRNGEISRRSMKSLMRRLDKLRKSIRHI